MAVYLITYRIANHDAAREEAVKEKLTSLPVEPATQWLGFAWLYESPMFAHDVLNLIVSALSKDDQLVVARITHAASAGARLNSHKTQELLTRAYASPHAP
jgi:hypothetical protein